MNSGRPSGWYEPSWTVSTEGATQPSPASISSAFTCSPASSTNEKGTYAIAHSSPATPLIAALSFSPIEL
jgi:hypothetical protein